MTFQELLKDERAAGREEGISLGEWKEIKSQVAKKIQKDYSITEIADMLEEDEAIIQKAVDELHLNE